MTDTNPDDTGEPFADADPEDGWDLSDSVVDLIDNISLRLQDLRDRREDRQERLDRIIENLAQIRERIENGTLGRG